MLDTRPDGVTNLSQAEGSVMYLGNGPHITNSRFIIIGHIHNSAENCQLPSQTKGREASD